MPEEAAAEAPALDVAPEVLILRKIEEELKAKYKSEIYVPPAIPSLVFTTEQQSQLREARTGFNSNVSTPEKEVEEAEIARLAEEQKNAEPVTRLSSRKVSLGGIVFSTPDNWTIWLNKKRVTPGKLPAEVVDLRVYKDFIELKWFDVTTQQVYPIRLRPNQIFYLDGRIFVPG